jgi:hypothetical protein
VARSHLAGGVSFYSSVLATLHMTDTTVDSVGNAAEHVTAVFVAYRNKASDLALKAPVMTDTLPG